MIFIDPPYNVPIRGHVSGLGRIQHREFAMASGEMSPAEFKTFLQQTCSLLAGNSQDGSLHFICMDWRHLLELQEAAASIACGPMLADTADRRRRWLLTSAPDGVAPGRSSTATGRDVAVS